MGSRRSAVGGHVVGAQFSSLARFALCLLLGFCSSCASEASDANEGGQTGSLIPCLGREEAAQTVTSDVAFAASSNVTDAELKNSAGQVIATTIEPLGEDGAVLIRAESALTVGEYTLSVDCPAGPQVRTLNVAEAEPLPTALGQLQHVPQTSCAQQQSFTLTLDPGASPYAALLQLEVQFGAGPRFVWVPFGALNPSDGTALTLELPRCGDGVARRFCAPRAVTTMSVFAEVAGEVDVIPPVEIAFDGRCREGEAAACTLRPEVGLDSSALPSGASLMGLVLLLARRRSLRGT